MCQGHLIENRFTRILFVKTNLTLLEDAVNFHGIQTPFQPWFLLSFTIPRAELLHEAWKSNPQGYQDVIGQHSFIVLSQPMKAIMFHC